MPGAAAPRPVAQSHAVREPSRIGRPKAGNVWAPSGVSQVAALASDTPGMAPMSAYSAWPCLSETIVLTQGMPWYLFRTASTWRVDDARSKPNQVLNARARLSALTSFNAKAVLAVQGNDKPENEFRTGP